MYSFERNYQDVFSLGKHKILSKRLPNSKSLIFFSSLYNPWNNTEVFSLYHHLGFSIVNLLMKLQTSRYMFSVNNDFNVVGWRSSLISGIVFATFKKLKNRKLHVKTTVITFINSRVLDQNKLLLKYLPNDASTQIRTSWRLLIMWLLAIPNFKRKSMIIIICVCEIPMEIHSLGWYTDIIAGK